MILPPILEDIVICDAFLSIVFGLALLIFLTLRRRRPVVDAQSDNMDALLIRIFLWIQLITGSMIIGGVLIDKLSTHKHVVPIIEHIIPFIE